MANFVSIILFVLLTGCTAVSYKKTVNEVDISKFMGKWYVIAGRLTFMEAGAHNAVEKYTWNSEEERIDIDFTFRKDSFEGKLKSIPQKAWIENKDTNAYWQVRPFWPFLFDYLVIDLDEDYKWVAIGVPSQNYLWIMAREWRMSDEDLKMIINRLSERNYNIKNIKRVPQKW